tara:strand:- start:85 stop:441 length:357 start_codon:yes stop_codon:yes gene_type:complete
MESKQKYTVDSRRIRKVILSADFFSKLEQESDEVMEIITNALENMNNEIHGHTSLALTFQEYKDSKPRFVEFNFIELNDREIKLYAYNEISSDRYLDMLLEGKILKTVDRSDTYINNY